MRRREFLQSSNLALWGLSTSSPLELTTSTDAHRLSEWEKPIHFTFVSINKSPNDLGLLLLNGEGKLNGRQVLAKGDYAFLSTYDPLSFSAMNSGTWLAEEIISLRFLPREETLSSENTLREITLRAQMTGIVSSQPLASQFKLVFNLRQEISGYGEQRGVMVYTSEGDCFSPVPRYGHVVVRTP